MIVKNEAPIIRHTLSQLLAKVSVDAWVIHDTGSEDGTAGIVEDFFAERGIKGRIFHRRWENFGANREYALKDAQGMTDYVLFWDADNGFEGALPLIDGSAHSYTLNTQRGSTVYPLKAIVRNDGSYKWRGVVHEGLYYQGVQPEIGRHLDGNYKVLSNRAGARSRDPMTYQRDAEQLVDAIQNIAAEDLDLLPRYTFYAANSWRDAKKPHEAVTWYRRRIALGGWADEVYMSWLNLGNELQALGDAVGALDAWLSGHEVSSDRAECLYQAARYQRQAGKPHAALILAREALKCPMPSSGRLFVWRDVYAFWLAFEVAMALKVLGKTQTEEFVAAVGRLKAPDVPPQLGLLGMVREV